MATAFATIILAATVARVVNVHAQDDAAGESNLPTWRLRPAGTPSATNAPATAPAAPVVPAAPTETMPAPPTEDVPPPAWLPAADTNAATEAPPATETPAPTEAMPAPEIAVTEPATEDATTGTAPEPPVEAQIAPPPEPQRAAPDQPAAASNAGTPPAPIVIETPKPQAPPPPPPKQVKHVPTIPVIEFQNAPVNAVLDYYARLTSRSIISAPNLGGVINFRSQTELTLDEAIAALDSVLSINNITVIPMGDKFLKVVQSATAKPEGAPFVQEGETLPTADSFVTQVIPLQFADAQEVVGALQPYLHGYGHLLALAKSNAILVTDTANTINKMLEIVKYVDQPSALRVQTKIYELKHAKAADVVQRLQSIIQETQQLGARPTGPTQPAQRAVPRPGTPTPAAASGAAGEESAIEGKAIITADDRTNKIFIMTRPSNFAFFDQLIEELDAKVDPDVIIRVVALDYADAEDMASQLNALITGGQPTTSSSSRRQTSGTGTVTRGGSPVPPPPTPVSTSGGAPLEGGFLQFAEGVRILPDARTNSLLLMATKDDLNQLLELIESLDTPVAQVLVEVVIGEVNLTGQLDMGVEIVKRMFSEGQVKQTGSSVASPGAVPPVNLSSITGELLSGIGSNAVPLALGAASGGLTYFATFQNLKLDVALRLLHTSNRFKVLSEPTILTLHNKEASIIVGESRPVPTSTVSDIVSTGSTAVRSSIEFKDIAIELNVTPIINPDGYVTMDIEQKINDIGGNVPVNGVPVPIITKREAKSSVTVKNESTIVLGGLIRENKSSSDTKVPILGDIPLLGMLFRSKSNSKNRTELIVFIRPTVLRNDAEVQAESRRRAEMLKAGEELDLSDRLKPKTHKSSKAAE
jgi:general secretion pathway protein D